MEVNVKNKLNLYILSVFAMIILTISVSGAEIKGFPNFTNETGILAPTCYFGACYDYAASVQTIDNLGISALLSQHTPEIDIDDGVHSLAEIAVVNTGLKNNTWYKISTHIRIQ